MEEKDRCWCGSMLKDKPHNCIGTRSRVEGLLTEVRLLQDAIDKSNVALEEAVKTKEERDRLLLQVDDAKRIISGMVAFAKKNCVNPECGDVGHYLQEALAGRCCEGYAKHCDAHSTGCLFAIKRIEAGQNVRCEQCGKPEGSAAVLCPKCLERI